mgnify:CR=1 FL=1
MQIAWLRHEDNWQDVKNAAMNTVGKDKGVYPTAAWKKKKPGFSVDKAVFSA